jgi:transposase-like protein
MNGKPISASKRARIVLDLKKGDKLTAIARRHGVSVSPVKAIRIAEGLQPLPTDAAKVNAARARDVMLLDARRRRAQLMVDLLDDAQKLRMQLWKPTTAFTFGGSGDDYGYIEHEIPQPDFKGKQALMISVGIAVDKSLQLEKHDMEGAAAARAAIIDLVDRLGAAEIA